MSPARDRGTTTSSSTAASRWKHRPLWYVLLTDIDDLKRAQEELRRSEAFLVEGQRLSMTGSFLWRLETDEITFSAELRRIFELEHVPVTLERILARVHPEDLPLVAGKIELARGGVVDHDYEVRLKMADGSVKYLRTYGHATRDPDGHLEFAGAMQDVTQRRRSEEALSAARSELARVARITSLSAPTASITHEVNQPLSGVITNAGPRACACSPPTRRTSKARAKPPDGPFGTGSVQHRWSAGCAGCSHQERAGPRAAGCECGGPGRAGPVQARAPARVIVRTELTAGLPPVLGDRVQLQHQ